MSSTRTNTQLTSTSGIILQTYMDLFQRVARGKLATAPVLERTRQRKLISKILTLASYLLVIES